MYHCAGEAHVGRAWESTESTFAINVRGTHHLLHALEQARRRRPRADSGLRAGLRQRRRSVDGGPSAGARQSLRAEQARAGDVRRPRPTARPAVTVARAFNHFGPRQNPFFAASGFARRIADIERGRWQPEIRWEPDARRDLTDVRDTVRAYRLIVERGQAGRPYNVCSGKAFAIRELLDLLIAHARVPVTVKVDPARFRPNDTPLLLGDPSRLRDELGWEAEIPIEQTIDDLLEYWRAPRRHEDSGDGRHRISRPRRRQRAAAHGHQLVIFSRHASRSGLPGTAVDGDIRDRPRWSARPPAATPSRIPRRSSASGAGAAPTSTTSTSAGSGTCSPSPDARNSARALHVLVPGASAARRHMPLEANDYQRTKVAADRARRRSGPRRRAARSRLSGRRLWPRHVHRGAIWSAV